MHIHKRYFDLEWESLAIVDTNAGTRILTLMIVQADNEGHTGKPVPHAETLDEFRFGFTLILNLT